VLCYQKTVIGADQPKVLYSLNPQGRAANRSFIRVFKKFNSLLHSRLIFNWVSDIAPAKIKKQKRSYLSFGYALVFKNPFKIDQVVLGKYELAVNGLKMSDAKNSQALFTLSSEYEVV
jgi:hypothetical protein